LLPCASVPGVHQSLASWCPGQGHQGLYDSRTVGLGALGAQVTQVMPGDG
jgi:hypothetical protein